ITFLNYFDPIRYAPRQYAPVLTLIGTHDQYFPLPNANLQQLAFTSAGTNSRFEKRLWLVPNSPHVFDTSPSPTLLSLVAGLRQWLDDCFGGPLRPLQAPQVAAAPTGGGRRFWRRRSAGARASPA